MYIGVLLICLSALVSRVRSECVSKSSQTWSCDHRRSTPTSNETEKFDYDVLLHNQQFERFFLKNYQLIVLTIDQYPSNLRLFNASGNSFSSVAITTRHRDDSNLRSLILERNNLRQLNPEEVYFPRSLERISLANNRLEVLDARLFSRLPNLKQLDVRNNQLKRLLPQLLVQIRVRLNNNPLECECTPEDYRIVCENATNAKRRPTESNRCMAPYFDPHLQDSLASPYLRFSTFVLICPIQSRPPPVIVWSTPFGNLIPVNGSGTDLLAADNEAPFYSTLTAFAGPFTARTRHIFHAFDHNHLSVTRARAALQHHISCSGTNMLGTYRHEFNYTISTHAQRRALWQIVYTVGFGFFMSLVAGGLCLTVKQTRYYPDEHTQTPPIYPTLTPNSASRTPPNFELNQWLSTAAANISGTLEQVRDKLRLGVQQVSDHMGQTMGRASELFNYGFQHAGGSLRQAAETSAAYLHSFRETSQQRLNTMRVQTLSSLRNPGHLMRTGMNMLTTQVNSLRDYCGVTTGIPLTTNYLLQQQQQFHHSPSAMSYLYPNRISTIAEEDELILETSTLINPFDPTPYAGRTVSAVLPETSGIGQLESADNSVLSALNNFRPPTPNPFDHGLARGHMRGGIGLFHSRMGDPSDDLVEEPERLSIYGEQRPAC